MKTNAHFRRGSLPTILSLILLMMMNLTSPSLTGNEPEPAPERPNILLILTDDQAWGDVSSHGNIHLPAQSGKLELRAVEIPGQGVVDVRYLELRLLSCVRLAK
jgi:hypothetical protein